MHPLDPFTRVLSLVIGVAGLLVMHQLSEPDRFFCALAASYFLLTPLFDIVLWWGYR